MGDTLDRKFLEDLHDLKANLATDRKGTRSRMC
jgi:hypothetical protein